MRRYYIDTTQGCTSQGGCPKCVEQDHKHPGNCLQVRYDLWNPSIFLKGHTYYVYFIYATEKTKQKYDIYLPKSSLGEANVKGIQIDPTNGYSRQRCWRLCHSHLQRSDPEGERRPEQPKRCLHQEQAICSAGRRAIANRTAMPVYVPRMPRTRVSAWTPIARGDQATSIVPAIPTIVNLQQCFGFRFTMPGRYEAPDKPLPPPADLFVGYAEQKDTTYFNQTVFKLRNPKDANDVCTYPKPPE